MRKLPVGFGSAPTLCPLRTKPPISTIASSEPCPKVTPPPPKINWPESVEYLDFSPVGSFMEENKVIPPFLISAREFLFVSSPRCVGVFPIFRACCSASQCLLPSHLVRLTRHLRVALPVVTVSGKRLAMRCCLVAFPFQTYVARVSVRPSVRPWLFVLPLDL